MCPAPVSFQEPSLLFVISRIRVGVLFGSAELFLDLALELLGLPLEILSGVTGSTADSAADPAFRLLGCALHAVLHAFGREVFLLSHDSLLARVTIAILWSSNIGRRRGWYRDGAHGIREAAISEGCGVLSA